MLRSSISHRTTANNPRTSTASAASTSRLSSTSNGASSRSSGLPRPDGRSLSHGIPRTPTSRITRPTLQESPYVRRSSAGGPTASRGGHTAPVPRKLNLSPKTDEVTMGPAPVTPGANSVRRGSLPRAPDRPVDNSERRGSGAATPRSRRGSNAAESFRDFRRSSLDNANCGEDHSNSGLATSANPASGQLDSVLLASSEVESLHAIRRASMDNQHIDIDSRMTEPTLPRSMSLVDESVHATALLPDRVDPTTPSFPLHPTPSGTGRKPMRFSDAAVYLGDVDRMRDSLGSRRSVDVNDPHFDLETPRLRRSSIGMNGIVFGSYEDPMERPIERPPLTSIPSNQENVAPVDQIPPSKSIDVGQAFSSKAFHFSAAERHRTSMQSITGIDDDHLDLGIDEDVEDLGAI